MNRLDEIDVLINQNLKLISDYTQRASELTESVAKLTEEKNEILTKQVLEIKKDIESANYRIELQRQLSEQSLNLQNAVVVNHQVKHKEKFRLQQPSIMGVEADE